MPVKTGQAAAGVFLAKDATGALSTPSVGPAGTLYVNGVANGAAVTITGTNPYKWAVTLPALAAGDVVQVYITATIATIATGGFVWQATADTILSSDIGGRIPAALVSGRIDASAGAIATDAITAASVKADAVTKIQATLSTLTAQQVWEHATRTLSSFGTLAADVWAAATRTITGGTVTTNSDKTGYALSTAGVTAVQSGLALEATLTAMKGAGWTDESLKAIYDLATSGVGLGDGDVEWPHEVTLDGDTVEGATVAYWEDDAYADLAVRGVTNSVGVVTFQLTASADRTSVDNPTGAYYAKTFIPGQPVIAETILVTV